MSPDERQAAIWDIVFQRNYETVPNLACELGVSTRTIYEDLSRMKGKYSIICREDMAVFTLHTSRAVGTGI